MGREKGNEGDNTCAKPALLLALASLHTQRRSFQIRIYLCCLGKVDGWKGKGMGRKSFKLNFMYEKSPRKCK